MELHVCTNLVCWGQPVDLGSATRLVSQSRVSEHKKVVSLQHNHTRSPTDQTYTIHYTLYNVHVHVHTTSASTRFLLFSSTLLLVYVELFRLATWGTEKIISYENFFRCIHNVMVTDRPHPHLPCSVCESEKEGDLDPFFPDDGTFIQLPCTHRVEEKSHLHLTFYPYMCL